MATLCYAVQCSDEDVFTKMAMYLEKIDKNFKNGDFPAWRTLQSLMESDILFEMYSYSLNWTHFRTFNSQRLKCKSFLPASDRPGHNGQGWSFLRFKMEPPLTYLVTMGGLWHKASAQDKKKFLDYLQNFWKRIETLPKDIVGNVEKDKLIQNTKLFSEGVMRSY